MKYKKLLALAASLSIATPMLAMANDTTLSIGGYIKGDILMNSHSYNGDAGGNSFGQVIAEPLLGLATEDGDKRFDITARESRLFFKTSTPIDGDTLKTHIEFDFYGFQGTETVSNSFNPRLRHAYATLGSVLVGQTWSTFLDLAGAPELNAFGLTAGQTFVRQGQVRYTMPLVSGTAMFAIENPEDGGDDQDTPDIIARYNHKADFGMVSAAVLSRKFVDGDNTASGTAVSLTARIPTTGKNDVRVMHNSGALGRYLAFNSFGDVQTSGSGIEAIESTATTVAYRHFWSPKLRSTISVATSESDDVDAISDSTHINLMYSPNAKVRYGIEFASWEVGSSSATSEFDFTQLSARYLF